jgi:hypothetical protein
MKTTLTVDIEYDPEFTDPERLASAMDQLLETALSTPEILDDLGNPTVREFSVVVPEDSKVQQYRQILRELLGCCELNVGEMDEETWRIVQRAHVLLAPCSRRFALYNYDTDELARSKIYDSYAEAVEAAAEWNNVMVVSFEIEEITAGGDGGSGEDDPEPEEDPGPCE